MNPPGQLRRSLHRRFLGHQPDYYAKICPRHGLPEWYCRACDAKAQKRNARQQAQVDELNARLCSDH